MREEGWRVRVMPPTQHGTPSFLFTVAGTSLSFTRRRETEWVQWTAVDSSGKELCIERGAHLKAGVQVRPGSYSLHFHNVGVVNVTVHSEEAAKDLFDVFLECRWEWLIWAMRYWVNRWVWISGMIRTERYSVHEQPQTITCERVQIPAVFCHTPF